MAEVFVFANIGREAGAAGVRDAVRKIKERTPANSWFGWAEIDEADPAKEHAILADAFPAHRWAGKDTRVPLAVPPTWRVEDVKVSRLSHGVPRQTPPRVSVEVVAVKRDTAGQDPKRVCVIVTHGPRNVDQLDAERVAWRGGLRGRVHHYRNLGLPVVPMFDGNMPHPPSLHNEQRVMTKDVPDYILYVPPGRTARRKGATTLRPVSTGRVDLHIDMHDALWASAVVLGPGGRA